LWWCANTETEKNETEYLRLKTDPNRTEFEKSKPTQPYYRHGPKSGLNHQLIVMRQWITDTNP